MPISNCQRCDGTGVYNGTRRDGTTYQGACFACQGGGYYGRGNGRWASGRRADYAPAAVTVGTGPHAVAVPVLPQATPAPLANGSVGRFAEAFPAEYAWLASNESASPFAASLLRGIARYGNLTPRQLAAVQRNLPTAQHAPVPAREATIAAGVAALESRIAARVAAMPDPADPLAVAADALAGDYLPVAAVAAAPMESTWESRRAAMAAIEAAPLADIRTADADEMRRAAERARAILTPTAPAPVTVDLDRVRSAMDAAQASGLRKVKLTFGDVTMKLSGQGFRNGGAGMILCYSFGGYKGYVNRANVFQPAPGRTVTLVELESFRTVGQDPRAAAATHGHDTGYCACCRRLLTDPPSVMAGIGPVCIRRFGWGF